VILGFKFEDGDLLVEATDGQTWVISLKVATPFGGVGKKGSYGKVRIGFEP
jgi:hypothetical protein